MFADLNMLMDLFMRRKPLHPQFLIKTHPQQLLSAQSFIDHYTKTHPTVGIAAKEAHYLAVGEYEVHIQRQRPNDGSAKRLDCDKREAA